MTEPLTGPIYVTVGRSGQPAVGFTWRIWSARTSFYLLSRAPSLSHLKLSLHGDDPRHPAGGRFHMQMDDVRYEEAVARGAALARRTGDWPVVFPGQRITDDARLVTRLRWTWDACTRLGPAPPPGELKRNAVGLAAPPPPSPGDAVDVDLIVSGTQPYWRNERDARANNACLGPLRNQAGMWLTGTVVKRSASRSAPPANAIGPRPRSSEDQLRGVSAAVDPEGFLWIIEQRMSRSALETAATDLPPPSPGSTSST